MVEFFRIAVGVATPLSLMGLIVGCAFWLLQRREKAKLERLVALPEADRAQALEQQEDELPRRLRAMPAKDRLTALQALLAVSTDQARSWFRALLVFAILAVILAPMFLFRGAIAASIRGEQLVPLTRPRVTEARLEEASGRLNMTVEFDVPRELDPEYAIHVQIAKDAAFVEVVYDKRVEDLTSPELYLELVEFDMPRGYARLELRGRNNEARGKSPSVEFTVSR